MTTTATVPLLARRAPLRVDVVLGAVAVTLALLVLLTTDADAVDPALVSPDALTVVVTGLGAAAVGLRRWAPFAGLVLLTASATAVSLTGRYTGLLPYLVLVALYAVAAHGARRLAAAGTVLVVGCFVALIVAGVPDLTADDVVTSCALAVAAAAIGDAVRSRRVHHREQLAAAESRARTAAAEAAHAVADERLRIARELHDVIAHSMSLIAVQAGVGAHLARRDDAAAEQALGVIADTSRDALAQVRSVVGLLRSGGDEQPSVPGLASLDALVGSVRQAGTAVEAVVDPGVRGLPAAVDLAAYRIVQESLTNAVRHAPGSAVRIALTRAGLEGEDAVDVEIRNAPPDRAAVVTGGSGYGLAGLRERAAALGGSLDAGPTADGGFRVRARLPLAAVA